MKPIRKGWIIWPPVIIVRYWIVQGTLYMNWVERAHRWGLELVMMCAFYWVLAGFMPIERAIVAFLSAHTFSTIFNGHAFAMLTHDLFWFGAYKEKAKFIFYVDEMYARLNRKKPDYLEGAVFFGSLTRGVFRDTSDLDVRFVAKEGFWNAVRTAHLVFVERLHALFAGFPIDAYMFMSEEEIRKKMDVVNEKPVSLYEGGENLREILPETSGYEGFRVEFLEMECKQD